MKNSLRLCDDKTVFVYCPMKSSVHRKVINSLFLA